MNILGQVPHTDCMKLLHYPTGRPHPVISKCLCDYMWLCQNSLLPGDWTSELKFPLASWIRGVKTKEVLDNCEHSLTCHYYELPRSDNSPHPNL